MTAEFFLRQGIDYWSKGLVDEAIDAFHQAIHLQPDCYEAYNNLGVMQLQRQQSEAAMASFRQAIVLYPEYLDAYNNLGLALKEVNQLGQAETCFRQAIYIDDNYYNAHHNLAMLLINSNRLEAAVGCLQRLTQLKPTSPENFNNLGILFTTLNQFEAAENSLRHAIALGPEYPNPYMNLGVVYMHTQRLTQAETAFRQALRIDPAYAEADYALGVLNLLQGQYGPGWEKYESRLRCADNFDFKEVHGYSKRFTFWQGEDLAGKTILLYHEQGFGDTILYFRYVQQVAVTAVKTILWVKPELAELMATSLPNITLYTGDQVPTVTFDYFCPLPSLPFLFTTVEATIPQNFPYLQPSPAVCAKWQQELAARSTSRVRIGVVWSGSLFHGNDINRSIPFALFNQLLDLEGLDWISLQVGPRSLDTRKSPYPIIDVSSQLVSFAETGGVIANLDLVIAVDTAVAHLAGAMGKPTWVLLPFIPDWRWQLARNDCPWYPSMRLFRQPTSGDWTSVLAQVKQALIIDFGQ
jgi:tetratricopeptide (TPR) repeat protein